MKADRFADDLAPHYDDAVSYCRALCASWSPSEAEDVLQSALLKAFEAYDTLRDRERFRPWLFRIITRTFYSAVRRAFWKRFLPIESTAGVERIPEIYHRPERQDDQWLLFRALSELSNKQRAAVLLFHVAGFSVEEIATIQNERSLSAVKSQLSRARARLRVRLRELEREEPRPPGSNGVDSQAGNSNHEAFIIPTGSHESKK